MDRLDRIKSIIAFCILAVVISSFVFLGQEHPITRYLAIGGITTWLITMYVVNRNKKKK